MADPECARRWGVSHILAEKGVSASLYSKKCMKMQNFHQEGGGGIRRVRPMLDPPLHLILMTYFDSEYKLFPAVSQMIQPIL